MKIFKFGGGILATPSNQIKVANLIKSTKEKVICVCSAMGRNGFPYSTDNLSFIVEKNKISLKEMDRLISCGEIISSIRLSYILNKEGINSYALSINELGIICDDNYSNGDIKRIEIEKINELIKKYDCLIVPGFIGKTIDNEIITLGRGNSDLTAVCLCDALKLDEVILFKDVEGIFHTPPQVYKKYKKYSHLSYDQMMLLNQIGFNVVSEKAIAYAKDNKVLINVMSFENQTDGSIISSKDSDDKILGFNFIDKRVYIVSYYPELIKKELEKELRNNHIFVKEEQLTEFTYSFEITKSVINIVRTIIIKMIEKLQ